MFPIPFDVPSYTRDHLNREAINCLATFKVVKDGDRIILTKGDTTGIGGGANAMKILIVGEVD